ncbi:hypothetical protein [Paenibacillus sp. y28]|uniref:hypothetical protein n=1 Tax=Paenibacillus sp. y28 TaxID=3129110 RepID=UPI003015BC83
MLPRHCLNKPGASKKEGRPWYRAGFARSAPLAGQDGPLLQAKWVDGSAVALPPSPFIRLFTARLRRKAVNRGLIKQAGLAEAYARTVWREQKVQFL